MKKREVTPLQVEIEKIVRPIVEGQIRGFVKEHPTVLKGVDWYKPGRDKGKTFTNSLAKRIVRDLTCGISAARLMAAVLECADETQPSSRVALGSAPNRPKLERQLAWARRFFFGFTTNQ